MHQTAAARAERRAARAERMANRARVPTRSDITVRSSTTLHVLSEREQALVERLEAMQKDMCRVEMERDSAYESNRILLRRLEASNIDMQHGRMRWRLLQHGRMRWSRLVSVPAQVI